ncbi:MAG: hypothetical protein DRR08_33820 [Candidatus Parabeggiatoa sp. nov. 2]|nr:MAG: hypothetical protein B6247_26750 [Beggiatoa sp. 4572_84]RKZ45837.1 MAG: hypothetical protein DRR08_33820 [Gammaproteobacteria bacterium]
MQLVKEPRESLLNLYNNASKDLQSIQANLDYLQTDKERIEKIKKAGNLLSGKQRYRLKMIDFYRQKNISAREEIINFLSLGIRKRASSDSSKKRLRLRIPSIFSNKGPYNFAKRMFLGEDSYNIQHFSEASNKFLDLYIKEYKKMRDLFKINKNAFFVQAEKYIDDKGYVSKISDLLEKSHLLNSRKKVITALINHYNNGDYISFINMVPLQIEGIFHDYCLELGIDQSTIEISSINEKLELINKKDSEFYHFEYYSFIFPVIRNDVAHGRLIFCDKNTSIMLFLDLLHVCELVFSESLPVNQMVNMAKKISEAIKRKTVKYSYSDLIDWIEFIDIEIPSFYQLDDTCDAIRREYEEDGFWNYLENKYLEEEENRADLDKAIAKLKRNNVAKNRCQRFLK